MFLKLSLFPQHSCFHIFLGFVTKGYLCTCIFSEAEGVSWTSANQASGYINGIQCSNVFIIPCNLREAICFNFCPLCILLLSFIYNISNLNDPKFAIN